MTAVEQYVDEYIMGEKKLPYVDILAIHDHRTVYRLFKGDKVNGKEKLYLFSATKPLTVTTAMRLVEKGMLDLDDPVCQYLPEAADTPYPDPEGNLIKNGKTMTVRHLFTMTAGFSYQFGDLIETFRPRHADTRTVVAALLKRPLDFKPGDRFQYSLCHDVLAAVAEVAAGKRFADLVKEEILAPLDMTHTGFHLPDEEVLPRCRFDGKTLYRDLRGVPDFVITDRYDSGGAGGIGTVEDYALFADALACEGQAANGYRLLNSESVKTLRTEQIASYAVQNNFTCAQGADYGYALGVRTRLKPTAWGLPAGEFGWDGAAAFYALMDPVHHSSVVIGLHVGGWPAYIGDAHLQIAKRLYQTFPVLAESV